MFVERCRSAVAGEPDGFAVVGVGEAREVLFLALVDWTSLATIERKRWSNNELIGMPSASIVYIMMFFAS